MKVLHLLYSNHFSGAENVVCQIVGMFKSVPDVTMVYCSRDGQIKDALAERGIPFAPIADLTVREVRRVIKEQKPDLIHAHDMRASFVAALAAGRTPIVAHVHGNQFSNRRVSLRSLAFLWVALRVRRILWVSKDARDGYLFRSLIKKKSTVLYNVVDRDKLYEAAERSPDSAGYDVVFLGRMAPEKDPLRFVRIARRILALRPQSRIAMLGDGELMPDVRRAIDEAALGDAVEPHGFLPNPFGILSHSSLLLMTSEREGMPMCALEAMALGLPVVSTPVGGLCELISDGENGYLSADDEVLAERAVSLLNDETRYARMSGNARQASERFTSVREYFDTVWAVYRNRFGQEKQ